MLDVSNRLDPTQKRALLADLLRNRAASSSTTFPLSYGQKALWFLHQFVTDSSPYNVSFSVRIPRTVDPSALRNALQALVDRHPMLRTSFPSIDGEPMQAVHGGAVLDLELVDASGWTPAELHAHAQLGVRRSFDLAHGPVLRASLFSLAPDNHVLLLCAHHVAVDAWSLAILVSELRALYVAAVQHTPAQLPSPAATYADYVDWHARLLEGPEGERLRSFWHEHLRAPLPVLDLPTDRPRPVRQRFVGDTHEFTVESELLERLSAFAAQHGTTLYVVMLSAFQLLLHRYTGQDDVLIGSPTAGRSEPTFSRTVGYFVSPVVIRSRVPDAPTFRELVARTGKAALAAILHQDYPFPRLVEELQPTRDPSRSPLFDVMFNLIRFESMLDPGDSPVGNGPLEEDLLPLEPFITRQQEGQFDVVLEMVEYAGSVRAELRYNTDLFDPPTVARLAEQYTTLLGTVLEHPDTSIWELPLLTGAEREQVLVSWNATEQAVPESACVHDLLQSQVVRTPDAPAARCATELLTYQELDARANQLAHHLRSLGVGPGQMVGVALERSLDMLVGVLGVLKAGGAYLPLDPSFPSHRLAFMLDDSGTQVLVTHTRPLAELPVGDRQVVCLDDPTTRAMIDTQSTDNPSPGASPSDLAYVIYTSGSTGMPKGVQIEHRNVVNFLCSMRQRPGLSSDDILLAVTTLSFDIAVLELYLPLMVGAQVVIAQRGQVADGPSMRRALEDSGANVMQATPVSWRMLLDSGWQPPTGFKALCGGESLPRELARDLLARGVELWNMYGPTETTVWSTIQPVTSAEGVLPVGRPIANTQVYVLDRFGQPTPIGVTGELYIGGAGVARGYLHRPELTAERFVPDVLGGKPQARLYRTGDLARWRADGTLELLGRADHQVKIRGFRIELGEIETVLEAHPGVRNAAVVARRDDQREPRLVAYVIHAETASPTVDDLRRHLRARLPEYMLPATFVTLEQFPLTPNGKLDRARLPAPAAVRPDLAADFVAPRTEVERTIAGIWQELLGLSSVGVRDNFFDLGGHSLLLVRVHARLRQAYQTDLTLAHLLEFPTIELLAQHLRQPRAPAAQLQPALERAQRQRAAMDRRAAAIARNRTAS